MFEWSMIESVVLNSRAMGLLLIFVTYIGQCYQGMHTFHDISEDNPGAIHLGHWIISSCIGYEIDNCFSTETISDCIFKLCNFAPSRIFSIEQRSILDPFPKSMNPRREPSSVTVEPAGMAGTSRS